MKVEREIEEGKKRTRGGKKDLYDRPGEEYNETAQNITNKDAEPMSSPEEYFAMQQKEIQEKKSRNSIQTLRKLAHIRMQQQNTWLESRRCNCRKEMERQDLSRFAEKLFFMKKDAKTELVNIATIGEQFIALGLCPSLDFIYKLTEG